MAELKLAGPELQQPLKKAADLHGVYPVVRIQDSWSRFVHVLNGKTEKIGFDMTRGVGVQVFTTDGLSGFAASDRIETDEIKDMIGIAAGLARASGVKGVKRNSSILETPALQARHPLPEDFAGGQVPAGRLETELLAMNKRVKALSPRVSVRSIFIVGAEEWRILRGDGTDVAWAVARSQLLHLISAHGRGNTATTLVGETASDPLIFLSEKRQERLMKRAREAVSRALGLLTAPRLQAGSYKLVIDYMLAAVLAHEAFGHAAETDDMDNSILGNDGRFAVGKVVAAPNVSITDGPLWGDFAYQPYSHNGVPRETVTIIQNGVLREGLSDVFSAKSAGVRLTGAGRAQSYNHIPLPRMSNIRLEVAGAFPVPPGKSSADLTPPEIYDLVLRHGLAGADEDVIYLSAGMGGQVNPKTGDFVFTCNGLYHLRQDGRLLGPTCFSGRILSALKAIKAGIGELCTELPPMMCGKGGQAVPAGGGANLFIVMERDENVTLGGKQ